MLTSTIVSLIWLAFLIAVFIFFLVQYRRLKQIAAWPVTEGKVVQFNLEKQNQTYWPSIVYEYLVNGQVHESEHFFSDTTHNTPQTPRAKKVAYNTAQAYLQEQPVTVHYNPQAPEQAVLDVNVPTKLIVIMLIVLGLIVAELLNLVL